MAASRDQRSGKSRPRPRGAPQAQRKPSERAKRELQKLDRERGISAELAARLQEQWGNQAVAQLLGQPEHSSIASTTAERRDLGEEEEELLDRLGDEVEGPGLDTSRTAAVAPGVQKGLPAAGPGAGLAPERHYGGDDEEDDEPLPLPEDPGRTALRFDRSGRGNLAKLKEHREKGRLGPETLEAARSELHRGSQEIARRDAMTAQPLGDALFRVPLEAWEDASLVAGRGCGVDERQDLAGPYDALGRPMAVGAFAQGLATTPLGRSLARLCAAAPGTLMPERGGLAGAAARMGSLAVLGMSADGLHHGSIRDRAVRTALAQAALDLTLLAAGSVAESVPPTHTLYARIAGSTPRRAAIERKPGPVARHWAVPALSHVGQLAALPAVLRWSPPPPTPELDPGDPVSVVDAALRAASPSPSELHADLTPLLRSIDALLAAGGRAQVELCTAALASRRSAFDDLITASLRRAYQQFRAAALELLQAREVLSQAHQQPLAGFGDHLLHANRELEQLRERMDQARQRCLEDLAAISELG